MPLDVKVLRFLVDSVLYALDECCLDEPRERRRVADAIVVAIIEFTRSQRRRQQRCQRHPPRRCVTRNRRKSAEVSGL